LLAVASGSLPGCRKQPVGVSASIEFSRIPQADQGGRAKHDIIEGRVTGAKPGELIVLYAKSGSWWVQPLVTHPFTKIQENSKWTNATHLGTEYAALLVDSGYQPAPTLTALPAVGGLVRAVAAVKGAASPPSASLQFSGYEWRVRDAPSSRYGLTINDPRNAWVDSGGAMHLRIAKTAKGWSCAEVSMTRSLGYGTYSFVTRDTSKLDPAAVFMMFTWDYGQPDAKFGEMDINISRWGNLTAKNAEYIIQPYFVPENTLRFMAPAGTVTHSFRWERGRATFKTVQGPQNRTIAEHVFTSSVPVPAIESVRMNVNVNPRSRLPMKDGAEVVIEKFEYLP
jgi:hypothetical protein